MLFIKSWIIQVYKTNKIIANDFTLITWLFLRTFALIYFAAFTSMAGQIEGLVGIEGILPLKTYLIAIEQTFPDKHFWLFPSIFWLDSSDLALRSVCHIGQLASLFLFFNFASRAALIICYFLYLSIMLAGQDFTFFQWDSLLLESGFLAIFLSFGSGICIFLYRWLIARFMFMGGLVKLASGDPTWANLTALNYHYQTQPLPSPLAYYFYHLPEWFHQFSVVLVFIIELIVPFMVFMPHQYRVFAACSFILLQSFILLTGNYTFFNVLTILLCLFILSDRDIKCLFPEKLVTRLKSLSSPPSLTATIATGAWACFVFLICFTHIWKQQVFKIPSPPLLAIMKIASSYSVVNNYGPFAVMTTERLEIIVEGSNDGVKWHEYSFKYKPGDLFQPLSWNIPHQPRLDWQMWFAALTPPGRLTWFKNFMQQIKNGPSPVLNLIAHNPFPEKPPQFVRALLYRYFYTSKDLRSASGQIWQRQYVGIYYESYQSRGQPT